MFFFLFLRLFGASRTVLRHAGLAARSSPSSSAFSRPSAPHARPFLGCRHTSGMNGQVILQRSLGLTGVNLQDGSHSTGYLPTNASHSTDSNSTRRRASFGKTFPASLLNQVICSRPRLNRRLPQWLPHHGAPDFYQKPMGCDRSKKRKDRAVTCVRVLHNHKRATIQIHDLESLGEHAT